MKDEKMNKDTSMEFHTDGTITIWNGVDRFYKLTKVNPADDLKDVSWFSVLTLNMIQYPHPAVYAVRVMDRDSAAIDLSDDAKFQECLSEVTAALTVGERVSVDVTFSGIMFAGGCNGDGYWGSLDRKGTYNGPILKTYRCQAGYYNLEYVGKYYSIRIEYPHAGGLFDWMEDLVFSIFYIAAVNNQINDEASAKLLNHLNEFRQGPWSKWSKVCLLIDALSKTSK